MTRALTASASRPLSQPSDCRATMRLMKVIRPWKRRLKINQGQLTFFFLPQSLRRTAD